MEVVLKGKLLEVIVKDYEFEGTKGTSYKLNIYSEGKLYNVSINKDLVNDYHSIVGQDVELECKIYIKGSYSLKLID